MRKIKISTLTLLCLTYFCSAQNTSNNKEGTFKINKPSYQVKGYAISYYDDFQDQYIDVRMADSLSTKTSQYVSIKFTINAMGKIINPILYNSLGKEYDEKAIKMTKEESFPGINSLYINKNYIICFYF